MRRDAWASSGHDRLNGANQLWPAGSLARLAGALAFALALSGCEWFTGLSFSRAESLTRDGRHQEAVALYDRIADRASGGVDGSGKGDPDRLEALWRAGEVYAYYLNDEAKADTYFLTVLNEAASLGQFRQRMIAYAEFQQFTRGDATRCAEAYRRLVQRMPNDRDAPEWWLRLARCEFNRADFRGSREATKTLVQRFALDPRRHEAVLQTALAWIADNQEHEARPILVALTSDVAAAEKAPDIVARAWYELAELQRRAGENVAAQESLIRALPHHPDPKLVQTRLASIRAATGLKDIAGAAQAAEESETTGE